MMQYTITYLESPSLQVTDQKLELRFFPLHFENVLIVLDCVYYKKNHYSIQFRSRRN